MSLMSIVFVPVYISILGFESYGLIGIFTLLQAWLTLLDLGTVPTINREMARYTSGEYTIKAILNLLKSIEILTIAISALIVIGFFLFSNFVANNWIQSSIHSSIISKTLKIMSVIVALKFFEGIYKSVLVGLQRQVILNVVLGLMATFRGFGAVIVLKFLTSSIEAFFIWQLLASILTTLILCFLVYKSLASNFFSGSFSIEILRSIQKFAAGVMGVTVIAMIITQTDKLILSKILSLEEFGHYSLLVVFSGVLGSLYSPIQQALIPRLNYLYAQNCTNSLLYYYHFGAQLVTILIGGMSIVLFFNSRFILFYWTHDILLAQSLTFTFQLMLTGRLLNNLMAIPYEMQLVSGWTSLTLKMNASMAFVLVPALFFVVPKYNMNGAALVTILVNLIYLVVGIYIMHKRILKSEKLKWYLQDVFKPLLYGVVVAFSLKYLIPIPEDEVFYIFYLCFFFIVIEVAMIYGSSIFKELAKKYVKRFFSNNIIDRLK